MMQFIVALIFFIAPFSAVNTDGDYKVESTGALTEESVPAAMRGLLDAKGLRVLNGEGKPLCEIWFRKVIPTTGQTVDGAFFGQIKEGTFVGIIHWIKDGADFRGQGIKAGYYSMRYGLILQDGNHLGVSPARDFLLACKLADEKDPDSAVTFDELMKLSRAASATGHPSSWNLIEVYSDEGLPKVTKSEHEHMILEMSLTTDKGKILVGLTLVGRAEG